MSQPECAVLPLSVSGECHRLGGAVLQISTPEPLCSEPPRGAAQHSGAGLAHWGGSEHEGLLLCGGEGCTAQQSKAWGGCRSG